MTDQQTVTETTEVTPQQATNAPFTEVIGGRTFCFAGLSFQSLAAVDDVARQQLIRPVRKECQAVLSECETRCASIRARYANPDGSIEKGVALQVQSMCSQERQVAKTLVDAMLQNTVRESADIALMATSETDAFFDKTEAARRALRMTNSVETTATILFHAMKEHTQGATVEDGFFVMDHCNDITSLTKRVSSLTQTQRPTKATEATEPTNP